MIKRILFVVLVILVFGGCFKNEVPVYKYPEWYINIQADANNQFYAVGEGKTLQDATNVALNDVAARISVSVESSYSSKTTLSGENYNNVSQREIKNSVKKIEFTNYQVLKKEFNPQQKYIVLIKVNKVLLASSMEEKILNDLERTKGNINQAYNNTIQKISTFQKIKGDLISIEAAILILHTLDEFADTKELLYKARQLSKDCNVFLQSVKFKINTISGDSKYSSILSSLITQKGFSVVSNNEIIAITIKATEQQIQSMENKILKGVVILEVYDSISNKKIGEETITVAGKSMGNFEQSKSFALKDFENKLNSNNLMQLLFGT